MVRNTTVTRIISCSDGCERPLQPAVLLREQLLVGVLVSLPGTVHLPSGEEYSVLSGSVLGSSAIDQNEKNSTTRGK